MAVQSGSDERLRGDARFHGGTRALCCDLSRGKFGSERRLISSDRALGCVARTVVRIIVSIDQPRGDRDVDDSEPEHASSQHRSLA